MSILLPYLLKVSITLAGLYLLFCILLRKDTFHDFKRFALLGNILISLALPLIDISNWREKVAVAGAVNPSSVNAAYLQMLLQQMQHPAPVPDYLIKVIQLAWYVYWAGVILLLLRFGIQLFSLYKIIRYSEKIRQPAYILAFNPKATNPFSFFRYVVLNPKQYEAAMLAQIMQHEQVHVSENHTLDILLSELYTIFFWFNPFAWLHTNLIKLNLEYIADKAVLYTGVPVAGYQMNLIKLMFPGSSYQLAANFNKSSISNRIHMMNKQHSPASFRLKYVLLFPLLMAFVLLFNATQAKKAENNIRYLSGHLSNPIENPKQIPLQGKRIITGIVKDADTDQPIPNVVIKVKGQATSTLSDAAGNFSIGVAESDKVLVFQFSGYNTTEMALISQSEMIILLKASTYTAQRWKSQEGNDTISGDREISNNSGEQTHVSGNVEIRYSTGLSDNSILYIIDGKRVDKATFKKLDVDKIASVAVYKEEDALRKYGAEDKKGVVEIRLKK